MIIVTTTIIDPVCPFPMSFSTAVLKTNFFKSLKTALSFRLEPSFLSADYPDRPFGVFMVGTVSYRFGCVSAVIVRIHDRECLVHVLVASAAGVCHMLNRVVRSLDLPPCCLYSASQVVGAEMRGFHVRFSDIARGGLRLIKSGSAQAYASEYESCFSHTYTSEYEPLFFIF